MLTLWASITGQREVSYAKRRIPHAVINKAVTIVGTGLVVWFAAIVMLETTQSLTAAELIFETTSALGTVGLSLGVTERLDSIGKVIIMIVMFIGRIGPLTLFTLLSGDQNSSALHYPEARLTVT